MVANKEIEKLEKSAVKLTVTVAKEDVRKEFDGLVDKYCKTAHVKGFRKGKVPAGILLQKYGESIRYETSMKVIEESLKELFEEIEERPIAYSTPELQDEALVNEDEDFTFSVKYDVFPDITLGEYKGLTVEEPEVKVGKKEIDEELEKIRDQNSVVMEKEKPLAAAVSANLMITVCGPGGVPSTVSAATSKETSSAPEAWMVGPAPAWYSRYRAGSLTTYCAMK